MEKKSAIDHNYLFTSLGAYKVLKAYLGREPRPCEFRDITDFSEAQAYKLHRTQGHLLDKPLTAESYDLLEMLAEVIRRHDKESESNSDHYGI